MPEILKIFSADEIAEILEENLQLDPSALALKLANRNIPAALIASQLASLQKAKEKLPTWYENRCLFTSRALEQSTAERVASVKNYGSGDLAIDLTCGLGVDAFYISKTYKKVIALEPDKELAGIVRYNFEKIGVKNIEVIEKDAISFLQENQTLNLDLIYFDPDRRKTNTRKYSLSDWSPNPVEVVSLLKKPGSKVMIKFSPMFDLTELERIFQGCYPEVVSLDNECKEITVFIGFNNNTEMKRGVLAVKSGVSKYSSLPLSMRFRSPVLNEDTFILEPDIAFYKADLAPEWLSEKMSNSTWGMFHRDSWAFSPDYPDDFAGRIFKVVKLMDYKPKILKRYLTETGNKKINIARKHFDLSVEKVRTELGVKEGGDKFLLLTQNDKGKRIAILAERIS